MTIQEMHYAFKQALNKLDTSQRKLLQVPEIDYYLNLAQLVYIKMVAFPKYKIKQIEGFEISQRNIDSIRTIVESNVDLTENTSVNYQWEQWWILPDNYLFYVDGRAYCSNEICSDVRCNLYVYQHDDEFLKSPFNEPDIFWREVPITFDGNNIRAYHKNKFHIDRVVLDYIRRPVYMHCADCFGGSYESLFGQTLTGTQDCELPENTHDEIVNLAALLASVNLQYPDVGLKSQMLNIT